MDPVSAGVLMRLALMPIGGAGDDMVPAYYSIGIRTYTSSIATVAPRLSLKLHELAADGCYDELTSLMNDCGACITSMTTA